MRTGSTISASSVVDPAEWIERNEREHPHRLFLRTPTGRGLSYQTLSNGSARLACALTRRGVTTGDRVAARVEKSVEAVLLYIACLPKGAMLTRANLASNATVLAEAWRFSGEDVLLHVLPLFHVHGLLTAINTVLASASSILLLPKFDSAEVLQHFKEATVFMGVPTHYTRLLHEAGLNPDATAHVRL